MQTRAQRDGHVLEVTRVTHETAGVWQRPASLLRGQQLSVYFRLLADTAPLGEAEGRRRLILCSAVRS